ncbi:MAG: hypothetical protein JOZ17_12655 [Acetobacteraceae bacterium]|nr:hypothetical protein [Acetobacteraceae bacterium]
MELSPLVRPRLSYRGLELIPGALLLCVSAALLWWSVPRLKEVFLEQESFIPTTHISAGSDCEFRQASRIEFNIDSRAPTTFMLAFRDIAPPSPSHPCEYIYVRFPGHIDNAYADRLSGPMMTVESRESIYEHIPGQKPSAGNAFLDSSFGSEARFTVAMKKLPEPIRSGDIYVKGELDAFLSSSSFSDRVLHYWIRLPGSRVRDCCQTETECEDDYLEDNPHVGVINLIFSKDLRLRSLLLAKSSEALTRQGLTRITTEDLTGSALVEDKENARLRDVVLLYAGALFAAGVTIGIDGITELIRYALRSDR